MLKLRRITESRTTDVWKQILAAMKKEARTRGLVVDKVTLGSFVVADKKDPEKFVKFTVDLLNTSAGEVIISLDKKTWKMGDTFVRDRRSSTAGGMKRPDMDAQVKNIMDMAQAKLEK